MSNIRRQSLISSVVVYFGFALGFLNTYLFAREGGFTKSQYGLTGLFVAIANIMYYFACMGMPSFIYKFYPYYKANVHPKKNDMATWSLIATLAGFGLVTISGIFFKDKVIEIFGNNSPELVIYYKWVFPFGFGLTIFSLFEALAWQYNRSVFTNYLREVQFRLFTTILIILTFTGIITSFDTFVHIYSFTYLLIALLLIAGLAFRNQLHFPTQVSRVTRKFFKKITVYIGFVWGGAIVYNVAQVVDSLIIAAVIPDGLSYVGIYTLAQNVASLIQAPQRAIIAASIGPLSQAWKDKDMGRITRIYQRSSINQLIFAVGMFVLVWINFTDGVLTFKLKQGFIDAKAVFFYIGLMRVIDLGTGVNAQIINTSLFWRFEFVTGIILLAMALPLNYTLAKHLGVIGPAISNLIAFTIYNIIRYTFLLKKFNMQPFTRNSLYTILLGVAAYLLCYTLFHQYQGLGWIILRSLMFLIFYGGGVLLLSLSPDIKPVWETIKKRLRR